MAVCSAEAQKIGIRWTTFLSTALPEASHTVLELRRSKPWGTAPDTKSCTRSLSERGLQALVFLGIPRLVCWGRFGVLRFLGSWVLGFPGFAMLSCVSPYDAKSHPNG